MSKNVSVKDITPIIEELIKSGTDVRLTVTGNSMFPMISSRRDSVVITRAPDALKKYDIPLYKRQNGEYVLHRIIKCKNGVYSINGDNQYFVEKGIDRSCVVGVVKSFCRKGREVECSDFRYRVYCRLWVMVRPFRGLVNRIYTATVLRYKRRKK